MELSVFPCFSHVVAPFSPLNSVISKISSYKVCLIPVQFSVLAEAMLTALHFSLTAGSCKRAEALLYISSRVPPPLLSCLFCHPWVSEPLFFFFNKDIMSMQFSKLSSGDLYLKTFHFMQSMLKNCHSSYQQLCFAHVRITSKNKGKI